MVINRWNGLNQQRVVASSGGAEIARVDNAGVAKHEQRGGMSRNHTEVRQQLNAPTLVCNFCQL